MENNITLHSSIEQLYFQLDIPGDLTILFQTLTKFQNLKKLNFKTGGIIFDRNLTASEVYALRTYLETKLNFLEHVSLSMRDEDGKPINLSSVLNRI